MIRNESEYQEAVRKLVFEKNRLEEHRARLIERGLTEEEMKTVLDPILSFHLQFSEEVEYYEKLKRRELPDIENFKGIGHILIAARIALGVSQRELASRLGVSNSQVSRDERNEYFGITVERASRVAEALGLKMHTKVELTEDMSANRVLENA
ncbi:MAG: helix-turn-helix transcriptional regulator [Acidiphilium sp.]|jgi:DNA-binding XRE family transcriptional regulator|nr:helix-turn-helix transcriptional regulator [Acidiphilium sp.]